MASSLVGDRTNIMGLLGTRGMGLSYLQWKYNYETLEVGGLGTDL